jgi:hypothetical protein
LGYKSSKNVKKNKRDFEKELLKVIDPSLLNFAEDVPTTFSQGIPQQLSLFLCNTVRPIRNSEWNANLSSVFNNQKRHDRIHNHSKNISNNDMEQNRYEKPTISIENSLSSLICLDDMGFGTSNTRFAQTTEEVISSSVTSSSTKPGYMNVSTIDEPSNECIHLISQSHSEIKLPCAQCLCMLFQQEYGEKY